MKTVLMHDWLTGFRGGERVLEAICELFPEAPLYTLIYEKGSASPLIENREIHSSFLNHIPGISKNYRKLLPLFPIAAESLNIPDDVRLVVSSSHCVIKGVEKPKNSVHVSYVHSPMRYMYDQYEHYFGAHAPLYQRVGAKAFRNYLVNWDLNSNRNVDVMIANSNFVRDRIRKFYKIDAEVIHPFVDLKDFASIQKNPPSKSDEYTLLSAFAPNKRVDLAIEAFNRMKKPLKVIGFGQLERELKAQAGPTIEFLGSLSREQVIANLASARALIFPGVEDFGIVPLEALAAGTPVIAFRAGGVLETLTDEDSVFFDELTPESLIAAVMRFESEERKPNFERLKRFSRERFQSELGSVVKRAVARL